MSARFVRIDHVDDPRLASYRDLPSGAPDLPPDRFVVESEHAVLRLLSSSYVVESVVTTPSRAAELEPRIPADVRAYVVDAALLRQLVGFRLDRTCLACAVRPAAGGAPIEALAGRTRALVVIAERIADPANLGALVRNCRAFGVQLLVADPRGADVLERRAIRASMGHVFAQPVCADVPVDEALARLRRALPGARVMAAVASGPATPVDGVRRSPCTILLVGNEGDGLSGATLRAADERVTVPVAGGVDSLNVAAAAGILLYELARPG
jgi:tRNA G18 (ribose-2'-O)-methylase SpoU